MRIDGVMIGRQEQDRDRMASEEPFRTEPFDLVLPQGEGPLWGLASEDLNVTLLCWGAGQGGPDLTVLYRPWQLGFMTQFGYGTAKQYGEVSFFRQFSWKE